MEAFGSTGAFGNADDGNDQRVLCPEQPGEALTCCFMAGVASTLVASGKGITRSKMLDHDWAHMLPGKDRKTTAWQEGDGEKSKVNQLLLTPA